MARRVLDTILLPEGIAAILRDRMDSVFPGSGQTGAVFVAVPATQKDEGLRLIREALENGYLDEKDGAILPPAP